MWVACFFSHSKVYSNSGKNFHIYYVVEDKLIISSEFYYIPVYENVTNLTQFKSNKSRSRFKRFKTSWNFISSTKTCLSKVAISCPLTLSLSSQRNSHKSDPTVSTFRETRDLSQKTKDRQNPAFLWSGEQEKQKCKVFEVQGYILFTFLLPAPNRGSGTWMNEWNELTNEYNQFK